MAGIIGNTPNYAQRRGAIFTFRQSIFLGNRSSNTPYTTTVDIGEPNLDRRLVILMTDDIPGQNVNLIVSCKVNGVTAARVGSRPDGYPITTQFSLWAANASRWTSQQIPEGTTATLEFDSNANMYWGPIVIYTVINLKSTTTVDTGFKGAAPWDLTVPAGAGVIFLPKSTDFNANNSPSTITNTTFRTRERTGAPNLTLAHYGGFDYFNPTPLSQTVSFTPDQGHYNYFTYR
jgi:hypothetical protein